MTNEKQLKTHRARVKCDNPKCDWTQDNAIVLNWHNKQCPKCNNCIIITDEDISVLKNLLLLAEKVNELAGRKIVILGKENCNKNKEEALSITVDTKTLRKK